MCKLFINDLIQIFKSSVSAVLPENLIRSSLKYNPTNEHLNILGKTYNLLGKNVYLVGTGKAVQNMSREVENILQSKIKYGIISIPMGSLDVFNKSRNVEYFEGAKDNLPDNSAQNTALKIKNLITQLNKDDLLLVLISGGGSALLPLPKSPITLEEKIGLVKKLANSGADIKELNTVRKVISDLKGGQLAVKAQPAQVVSLILSDIVGDPLDLIASGPTVQNTDGANKAVDVLKKYNLIDALPKSVQTLLENNGDNLVFPTNNTSNYIIGSNKISTKAAVVQCIELNYLPLVLSNKVTGNVQDVANKYSKLVTVICKYLRQNLEIDELKSNIKKLEISGTDLKVLNEIKISNKKPLCLILGGEITVAVKGTGKGGRNQQLALEFSKYLHKVKDQLNDFDIFIMSAGTDGIDGPTDAAGAIGYLNLISESTADGLDVDKYLANNDTYNFFKLFKNGHLHVLTGHTNTNVMDIHLIIIKRKLLKVNV